MATPDPDLRRPVAAVLAKTSAAELGRELGLSRWAAREWTKVPDRHVRRVSEVTGIPRHELRPDIFEAPGS